MSSTKGTKYPNASRTTEKEIGSLRSRQLKDVRQVQQFSIAHMNTKDSRSNKYGSSNKSSYK